MELYSSAFAKLAGSQSVRVAGSRPQGPVGQVSRGLGARAPTPRFEGKGERKRVFTLSAFGNHPTRPPRSADLRSHLQPYRTQTNDCKP